MASTAALAEGEVASPRPAPTWRGLSGITRQVGGGSRNPDAVNRYSLIASPTQTAIQRHPHPMRSGVERRQRDRIARGQQRAQARKRTIDMVGANPSPQPGQGLVMRAVKQCAYRAPVAMQRVQMAATHQRVRNQHVPPNPLGLLREQCASHVHAQPLPQFDTDIGQRRRTARAGSAVAHIR
jgi:hypothetical protein